MNRKALVTLGVGRHADYLDISRPTFQVYAERHGYTYLEAPAPSLSERPPSWEKVIALKGILNYCDEVLWVDCDCVIVNGEDDLVADVPPDAWQAMVTHTVHLGFHMGEVPSCGVWLVRKPMLSVLEQIWGMKQYINHPWWEQAAMHELLGYQHNGDAIFPVVKGDSTLLRERTYFLDESWNSVDMTNENAQPRIMHMAGLQDGERMKWMQYWAGKAITNVA